MYQIWRFPEMGVPPVIIHLMGLSLINQPFGGTPMTMETPKKPPYVWDFKAHKTPASQQNCPANQQALRIQLYLLRKYGWAMI